eukprot:1190972-Prorocentrum_minimum.AAC.1
MTVKARVSGERAQRGFGGGSEGGRGRQREERGGTEIGGKPCKGHSRGRHLQVSTLTSSGRYTTTSAE